MSRRPFAFELNDAPVASDGLYGFVDPKKQVAAVEAPTLAEEAAVVQAQAQAGPVVKVEQKPKGELTITLD